MTILYDLVDVKKLNLKDTQKKSLISEIIMTGNYNYFEKFKSILVVDITSVITSVEMLRLIPLSIDIKLFEYILDHYEFEQGQHFFYNYATISENSAIKELVYNYFVDNYSHVMLDKMEMYETLIEK